VLSALCSTYCAVSWRDSTAAGFFFIDLYALKLGGCCCPKTVHTQTGTHSHTHTETAAASHNSCPKTSVSCCALATHEHRKRERVWERGRTRLGAEPDCSCPICVAQFIFTSHFCLLPHALIITLFLCHFRSLSLSAGRMLTLSYALSSLAFVSLRSARVYIYIDYVIQRVAANRVAAFHLLPPLPSFSLFLPVACWIC